MKIVMMNIHPLLPYHVNGNHLENESIMPSRCLELTLISGKAKKYSMQCLEEYDPRPEGLRNSSAERLPQLPSDIRGEGLTIA